jgi:hypothetical protein
VSRTHPGDEANVRSGLGKTNEPPQIPFRAESGAGLLTTTNARTLFPINPNHFDKER